jgi:WD40 repeat protein
MAIKGVIDLSGATLRFSMDGKKLASAGTAEVKLWEVSSGQQLASFRRAVGSRYAGFSKDLRILASPNYQEIDLWDVETAKIKDILSEHRGEVIYITYSLDGGTLIASSARHEAKQPRYYGDVKLWDTATSKVHAELPGPFGAVAALALSPDGKMLALLDSPELYVDPEVKLVEVATGRQRILRSVPGHAFTSLSFTLDGRLFVTGTPDDRTQKLWEVSWAPGN